MRSLLLVGAAALVPPQRTTQKATIHRASEKSTLTEAGEYEAVAIRAEFPEDLRGTLYRLGPGGALRRGQERLSLIHISEPTDRQKSRMPSSA